MAAHWVAWLVEPKVVEWAVALAVVLAALKAEE
jgi:hypothetical protein